MKGKEVLEVGRGEVGNGGGELELSVAHCEGS